MIRRTAASLACVLLTAMTLLSCARPSEEEVESETVVPVRVVAATRGTIRAVIQATGQVVSAPGAELMVVAPEVARLAEIPYAEGDHVKRGDVLARFEAPNLTADVEKQQAEVARAEAALQAATAAQARAQQLFDRGVGARREVEEGVRNVAEAQAAVTQARASLTAARAVAGRAEVRATFNGVIARRTHNPGDVVDATAADAVLRVIDPRRLEVVASIPLAESSRVVVGAPARIASASTGEENVSLKVLARPASVDPGTATLPVRLRFDRTSTIPAGAFVQVEIAAERHAKVITVPSAAIVHDGDESAVFVTDGNTATRQIVTLGLTDGVQTEIVSGVNEGEMVIVEGQAGLPDEARVTLVNTSDEASRK